MDVIAIILIILTSVLLYFFTKYRDKPKRPPPGPTEYPLVGNTFTVDAKKLHISLTELADKYGDIYKLYIFGRETVVLNSVDLVREALLKEPNASVFALRLDGYFGNEFMFKKSDIAFSDYSEVWTKRRKFSHRLLKAYGEGLKEIEKRLHGEIKSRIEQVKKYHGEAFDPELMITNFLIGIITNLLTGKNYDSDSEFSKAIWNYDQAINEILNPMIAAVLSFFPFMKHIPGRYKDIHQRCKTSQQHFCELVKKIKDECESGMIHDLYQEMSTQDQLTENERWLSEEVVFAILSNMVGGGILTSKGAIWSMINILISNPDVQKKLQEEVDTIVGSDRLPSLKDKGAMPYTEAVVLETIRFISHLPLAVPHVNSKDAKLGGFDIKKGSMIFINAWKVHSDEKVFVKPNDFLPERFIGEDGHLLPGDSPVRQSFLAFGIGKRACIGEVFAKNRIFLFLASMMQAFTFVSENGKTPPLMVPADMAELAIKMPQRYKCKAIQRSK